VHKSRQNAAQKDHFWRTLRAIHDGVVATDLKGEVVIFNEAAENLTGCRESDALGKPLGRVLPMQIEGLESQSDDLFTVLMNSPDSTRPSGRATVSGPGGVKVAVGYSAAKIRDRDNEVSGVVIVFNRLDDLPAGQGTGEV
jgi:PAS domain S-box-containing protein